MDKIITNSAQNYAQALFETGQNFEKDLEIVQQAIFECADLSNIISNPSIDLNVKFGILNEIFEGKINNKVLQFIKILTEKNRLGELTKINEAYLQKIRENNNIELVEITSAIILNDDIKTKILNKLNEKLNKKIIPQWNIDEKIIAGLVFKINDNIIDTSLLNKIENIGKNIR